MPRKLKLSPETTDDYTVFGVACHLKDYRFTFFMNDKLGFRFKRAEDFKLGEGPDEKSYSFYVYDHVDERRKYYLVSNYHESGRLIPEEKGVDFFLIAEGSFAAGPRKEIPKKVQSIPQVLAAFEIPPAKKKNLGMIFEEIELHFLD